MSGQPAGRVYHPVCGDEIAADAAARRDLVRFLRERADDLCHDGDRLLPEQEYRSANRLWRLAARHQRAAQSIDCARPTDPQDHRLIEVAWRAVTERRKETAK